MNGTSHWLKDHVITCQLILSTRMTSSISRGAVWKIRKLKEKIRYKVSYVFCSLQTNRQDIHRIYVYFRRISTKKRIRYQNSSREISVLMHLHLFSSIDSLTDNPMDIYLLTIIDVHWSEESSQKKSDFYLNCSREKLRFPLNVAVKRTYVRIFVIIELLCY